MMDPKEMMDKVSENLKEHDWKFRTKTFDDGECGIDTNIRSSSGFFQHYDIRLLFRKWDMQALYYIPMAAPEAVRKEVAEYLTRINWRTKYGEFLMDFEDGEIRLVFLAYPEAVMGNTDEVMSDVFDLCRTADRYAAGLVAVIAGGKSAADAFAEATKPKEEPAPEAPAEEPAPDAPAEDATGASLQTAQPEADGTVQEPAPKGGKKKAKKAKPAGEDASVEDALKNYSLKGLNVQGKVPLEKIVAAVKKFKEGKKNPAVDTPRLNILLSGAPGSGKTAFVKYLAHEVGMPLRTVRASDLLSRYSGETEQKTAEMFRKAKENGEMLFLDEIDSFLQDRKDAVRSWEVTQVNELLQQMEAFGGVMVGATNFADNLDKAVLRRFTYKLKLDYLTDEGKGVFFKRYFKTPLTAEETVRLNAIGNLTPGDFRTVREELFYLSERQTNAERLEALEAESAAKGRERARIGF